MIATLFRFLEKNLKNLMKFYSCRDTRRPVIKLSNGFQRTIMNEVFSINSGGKIMAQRTQLPLDLGSYTLPRHKFYYCHIYNRLLLVDMTWHDI